MDYNVLNCFVLFLFSILCLKYSSANDVVGCGGFVTSSVNINYKPIQIKLYTKRGIVKYTSDCAPNNGYYFVPLYDIGDYVLRIEPPNSWSFEPMEVSFNFDGKNDICSKQVDINFSFKGFAIFGKVFSLNSDIGPKDVKVNLLSKENNNIIKQNSTSKDGSFIFNEVLPGQYIVEAFHETYKFERSRMVIEVVNDNVYADKKQNLDKNNQITVMGYSVGGKVLSDGQPVKGVQFALFGKKISNLKNLNCDEAKPLFISKLNIDMDYQYICQTISSELGLFTFDNLPVGEYILYSFYESQNIRFEVTPSKYNFEITHNNFYISKPFEIGGFTIFGTISNILNLSDKIKNVQLSLIDTNGKNEMVQINVDATNSKYSIDNIKSSKYLIKAVSKNYQFEDIVFTVSPNSPNIPIISPSKFEICGKILFINNHFKNENIELLVMEEKSKTIRDNILINGDNFCLFLPGGNYLLQLNSKLGDLKFKPDILKLKVDKPKLDVLFEQFTAQVVGRINLKQKIESDDIEFMSVTLSDSKNNLQTIFLDDLQELSKTSYEFKFNDILPGEYSVSLGGKQLNSFCWTENVIPIKILDADITNLIFKQKGFLIQIALSHLSNLFIRSPSDKLIKINKETINEDRIIKHCGEEIGKYRIIPQDCHKFFPTENESMVFDTQIMAGKMVSLTAIQHMVSFTIQTGVKLPNLTTKVHVISPNNVNTRSIVANSVKQIESKETATSMFVYEFSFYEKPMVDIKLEPLSTQLLFKPSSYNFKLNDECYDNVVRFQGRYGVVINGSISEKIKDVLIQVYDAISNEALFETRTNSAGTFSAGPFDDDLKLDIKASLDGFVFKSIPNQVGHFVTHKLSSISAIIVDENGEQLNEVLISLSGGENNFRKNSFVTLNGTLQFDNLHPGQYFIRFSRKEYEFEPSSKMITLQSGNKAVVKVVGKKIAFSSFGTVESLNGEPEAGIFVEAIGLRNIVEDVSFNCSELQEETVSEANGAFRILGLLPQCQYVIRLKIDESDPKSIIKRSIPRAYSVRVQASDIKDMRFVVLFKNYQMDLSSSVNIDEDFLTSLKVQLFNSDKPNSAIFKQSLSSLFFFLPSIPMDGKKYILRIDSTLDPSIYDYNPIVHSFVANQSFIHFNFDFKVNLRSSMASTTSNDQEHSFNSLYIIILLLITYVLFFRKQITDHLLYYKQIFQNDNLNRNAENNGENISLSKKKVQPKKLN